MVGDASSDDRHKFDDFISRVSAPIRSVTKTIAWEIVSPPLFGFPGSLNEDASDGTTLVGGTYWRSLPRPDVAQRPIVALTTGVQRDFDALEDQLRRSHPARTHVTAVVTVTLITGDSLTVSTAAGVARFKLPHDRFLLVHMTGAIPENSLSIRESGSVEKMIDNWETTVKNSLTP